MGSEDGDQDRIGSAGGGGLDDGVGVARSLHEGEWDGAARWEGAKGGAGRVAVNRVARTVRDERAESDRPRVLRDVDQVPLASGFEILWHG